ncbi:hypothetical protein [Hyphomicrobium sp. 1Nfss2.1]
MDNNDDEIRLRDKIIGYAWFYVPQALILLLVWYALRSFYGD